MCLKNTLHYYEKKHIIQNKCNSTYNQCCELIILDSQEQEWTGRFIGTGSI